MITIKSYTDYSQAQILSKILPLESADMWYQHTGISIKDGSEKPIYFPMVIRDCETDYDVPCWSLAALLSVLPHIQEFYPIIAKINDRYVCRYANSGIFTNGNNPIDACVAMIEKLNELNLL